MASMREGALVALLLGLAAPAAAEIYRWTDEQGNEHFSSNAHDVPPEHRTQAREAGSAAGGHVNRFESSGAPPPARSLSTTPRTVRPAKLPPPGSARGTTEGTGRTNWQSQAQDLELAIQRAEERLDECEKRRMPDLDNLRVGRNVHRNRSLGGLGDCDPERQRVEEAEQRLADFEDRAREAGVPPGWIR
jgi:hypothetical protein